MKDTLKIGLDSVAPVPMHTDYHSAVFEGFEVDLMQEIASHLDLKIAYEISLWKNILEKLYKGQLDMICSAVTMTPSRQRILEFSAPYLQFRLCAVVNQGTSLNNLNSFEHKTIGVRIATEAEKYIMGKFPGHQVIHAEKNEALYTLLLEKKLDVVIDDSPIAGGFLQKYKSLQIGMFLPDTHSHYAIAMKKGDVELKKKIDKVLKRLKENGTYHRIYKKWFTYIEL
ncbi:substrate-binding periplasmic protein [Pedobacter nutrimenti]|jgi:ABC-type amino acid transport substrate-binding protein|uniref:Glutamine transport system substrate-binding protein n=1 Tax=Pedobacter nutrimenti TaxID=1241337 RepID=A0A318U7C2_9SPHI|nr:transporter substrate-binding domain-containing protein [Pedobacter nutrimenti]PYF69520.1 glutamine transport system substrate-binding protein [Pedobacter nutrimenti]